MDFQPLALQALQILKNIPADEVSLSGSVGSMKAAKRVRGDLHSVRRVRIKVEVSRIVNNKVPLDGFKVSVSN